MSSFQSELHKELIETFKEEILIAEHDIAEFKALMRFTTDEDELLNYVDCLTLRVKDKQTLEKELKKLLTK